MDGRDMQTHGWIWVRQMRVDGVRVGVHPHEHLQKQAVEIDVGVWAPTARSGASDSLGDTVDWARLAAVTVATARRRHYNLIESLVETLAATVLETFEVAGARIEVRKLGCMAHGVPAVAIERARGERSLRGP